MKRSLSPASRITKLALVLGGVLALCIFLAMIFSHEPPPPPVVIYPQPYHSPRRVAPWPDRWIPDKPSWTWAWRLKEWVLGPARPLDIDTAIYEFTNAPGPFPAGLLPAEPELAKTNGLRIWRLGEFELSALENSLKAAPGTLLLASPRCSTADRVECSLFVGGSLFLNGKVENVGLRADYYTRVRSKTTDLTASIIRSEPAPDSSGPALIVTNLAVATRIQLPKGQGVFLLQDGGAGAGKRMALFIHAKPPSPRLSGGSKAKAIGAK